MSLARGQRQPSAPKASARSSRYLLALVAAVALYFAGYFGLREFVILPSFVATERDEAIKDITRCVDAIRREAHHLGRLANDWGVWDDTYRFVQDGNDAYIKSNLQWESIGETTGINLIYICRPDGSVVWGQTYDPSAGGRIQLEEFPEDSLATKPYLLKHESADNSLTGIVLTTHGPMLLSSRTILTSEGEGPPQGTLIMGRFLDQKTLDALAEQTQVGFKVTSLRDAELDDRQREALALLQRHDWVLEKVNPDYLHAYGLLADVEGNPALLVTAEIPRAIMARGREAARFASVATLVTAIATIVIGSVIVMMIVNLMRGSETGAGTKRWQLSEYLAAVLVGAAGLVLSLGAFLIVRNWEGERNETNFKRLAAERAFLFRLSVEEHFSEVRALSSFFESSQFVERGEFHTFVGPLLAQCQDVRGFMWIPRVSGAERESHESAARSSGVEDYQIRERSPNGPLVPAGQREVYYPVCYLDPFAGNEAIAGFDMGMEPALLAMFDEARDASRLVATEWGAPGQEALGQPGLLVCAPVYGSGAQADTIEDRRANLVGFVGALQWVGVAFEDMLAGRAPAGINIRVVDNSAPAGERILYTRASRARPEGSLPMLGDDRGALAGLKYVEEFDVAGRKWSLICTPAPVYLAANSPWQSRIALAAGLLLTAWVTTYVIGSRRRAAQIERLVATRTAELAGALQREQCTAVELEAAMQQLTAAMQEAQAATRAKSEFLANMSHEIRTPMTAILGFAENLLDPTLAGEEWLSAVRTIHRNGTHLLGIINDILDLSKVEAGKMSIETVPCPLGQVLAEVASLVQVRAEAKGLPFKIEFDGAVPETIQTDPTRLRQILLNVVSNAVKFTKRGSVRLLCRFVDQGRQPLVQFDVVDTGLGMTEEQVGRLFQPFTQADTSTTREFGGTGLGLAISKRLAAMLGGDVALIETRIGGGTCFRITVAAGPSDGVKMIDDPMSATVVVGGTITSGTDGESLRNCRILLAEDGPDNQRLISLILRKAGAQVTVSANGKLATEEALAAQQEGDPFDVILMDMQMPVMDGYDAARALRAKGYTGPIIALTAHAMEGARQKCLRAGCDGYAAKPIDRVELIRVIRGHLKPAVVS